MISEFRMLICELLLNLIISIAPKNHEGYWLVKTILDYLELKEIKNLLK